jgi:opacity protein-like surface antigen
MRRSAAILACLALAALTAGAQAVHSANQSQFSLTVGGAISAFQPGTRVSIPDKSSAENNFGAAAYIDLKVNRWIQLEAESRWLRFTLSSPVAGLKQDSQDNYLVGPRFPLHHFGKATPYAKALFGYGRLPFSTYYSPDPNSLLAYGGGLDYRLTRKISIRPVDFEYQQWIGLPIHSYGASSGINYRIF